MTWWHQPGPSGGQSAHVPTARGSHVYRNPQTTTCSSVPTALRGWWTLTAGEAEARRSGQLAKSHLIGSRGGMQTRGSALMVAWNAGRLCLSDPQGHWVWVWLSHAWLSPGSAQWALLHLGWPRPLVPQIPLWDTPHSFLLPYEAPLVPAPSGWAVARH